MDALSVTSRVCPRRTAPSRGVRPAVTDAVGPPGRPAELVSFHHVALSVRNRDESAAWYAEVLGFTEFFREESPHRKTCVMAFPGGGYSVGIVEHVDGGREHFDPRARGLDHLAFTVASRDELDGWAKHLTAAGVEHSDPIEIAPGAILNFKDPDGISLALFWDRRGADGRSVGETKA